MLKQVVNLVFPNVCGFCLKICKDNICVKCRLKLKKLEQAKIVEYKNKNFEEAGFLFKYENITRQRILQYKFYECGYLYRAFSQIFIENKDIVNFINNYDIIIPVPIHKERKRQRGYNQCELIAKEISKKLRIDMENDVLLKIKNTKPQSTMNKENRKNNAKDVYTIQKTEKIIGKKILLLDDIYTTGSTLNECSRIIKTAKPEKIGILTIAKD